MGNSEIYLIGIAVLSFLIIVFLFIRKITNSNKLKVKIETVPDSLELMEEDNSLPEEESIELYEQIGSYLGVANALHTRYPHLAKPNQLRSYVKQEVHGPQIDYETVETNVRLAKANQALVDRNRIKDKAFREHARIENAVISYNEAILAELENHGLALGDCPRRTGPLDPSAAALVVHLSDNHFNELVNLPTNPLTS